MSWMGRLKPCAWEGRLAVTAHVQQNDVIYEWHGEWATRRDLQDISELKELMRKSYELVARISQGMKDVFFFFFFFFFFFAIRVACNVDALASIRSFLPKRCGSTQFIAPSQSVSENSHAFVPNLYTRLLT